MKYSAVLITSLVVPVLSGGLVGPVPVAKTGLAGINGFTFYDPYCGHACFRCISPFTLPCSDVLSLGGLSTGADAARQLASCRSDNFAYLGSIAWCMHLYCADDVPAATREKFWASEITGDLASTPRWSYGETLANVSAKPPTVTVLPAQAEGYVLNDTILTNYETFEQTAGTLKYFFRETAIESYFGLSTFLALVGIPFLATWLRHLPFSTRVLQRVKPYLMRSSIGTYHDRPLPFLIGNVPTVGQTGYIVIMAILNIVFLGAGYETSYPRQPFQWYENRYQELLAYFVWRTGVLAFCHMPVLVLFSSRNNILMWLTNWSHSTYLLLHRWVARWFLLHTLLHSIASVVLYRATGQYASTAIQTWWVWGIVGTVTAVVILLSSVLVFRQRSYELFLITHIVFTVICFVGCWYHVYLKYVNTFGYETWLYMTFALWGFDRLARAGRMLKAGVRRSRVIDVGASVVRIDIPGLRWSRPGYHAYVYFPTLRPYAPWENHPFSMVPTSMLADAASTEPDSERQSLPSDSGDVEKAGQATRTRGVAAAASGPAETSRGVTLFVRKSAGLTRLIENHESLLTLVEGPYPSVQPRAVLECDRLLLIGGGIGITGILPFVRVHPNTKLFHGVKTTDEGLLTTLKAFLDGVREKEILVGRRIDIGGVLRDEAAMGWARIGVLVCGPAGMCDDVRAAVAGAGQEHGGRTLFELEVDSFSY